MKLLPSIASADPLEIGSALRAVKPWPYLHIDVEDGNFVPNITFGMKAVRAICRQAGGCQIQAHLMVWHPERYIEGLAGCGVDSVVAHLEALDYPLEFLNRCRLHGMKGGLAVNMKTPVSHLMMFQNIADQFLLMTSEPDCAGEVLFGPALDRVVELAGMLKGRGEIYADGGLSRDVLERLSKSGIHGAVLGRLVFQNPNPLTSLQELAVSLKEE